IVALFVAGLVIAGLHEGGQMKLVKEGEPAPVFDLEKYQGGRARLSDYGGKLVVLDFWGTWCGPCREEMPYLVKVAKEYEKKGVVFVAAADDASSREDITEFAAKVPGLENYAAFSTDALAHAYKVEAFPTMYFIAPDGKVILGHRALVSESWFRDTIEEHLPK
ncbi:MAG: TlpA family protein disulfide reductase, partial [Myxococcaceae bacterium]